MKRCFVAAFLSFLLVIAPLSGVIFAEGTNAPPLNDGIYEISTAEQLVWFAETVNAGNTSINAILMNDIDLSSVCGRDKGSWTPIGYYLDDSWEEDEDCSFNGSFNGDMHAVRGLYIDSPEGTDQGLFGAIGANGLVMLTDVYGSVSAYHFVGGICGRNWGGAIMACRNFATVNGEIISGGICGQNRGGNVIECVNEGSIRATRYAGGICGNAIRLEPSGEGIRANVLRCENRGTVDATEKYCGGIIGVATMTDLTDCLNKGALSGNYLGGIAGQIELSDVRNSLSVGTIAENYTYCGGVTGRSLASWIANCYFDSEHFDGPAIAMMHNSDYVNCEAVSAEMLKSGMITYFLNGGETNIVRISWGQNLSGEDADSIPVLAAQHSPVYQVIQYAGCVESNEYTYVFKNQGEPLYGAHEGFENGFCTACGALQPDYMVPVGGVYEISTAEQLKWFAAYVNEGNTDVDARLCRDIDLSAVCGEEIGNWEPIGNTSAMYNGSFDGNGKTISGLYIDAPGEIRTGLFCCIGSDGELKNLSVKGSVSGEMGVAGICSANRGLIENCNNYASVYATVGYAGGICSVNNEGTITRCRNYAETVQSAYNFGCGGICGVLMQGLLTECSNYGAVSGPQCIGGVAGNAEGEITNCANYGDITGESAVGGIGGCNAGTVSKCLSAGSITGESEIGGICGFARGVELSDCYFDSDACRGQAIGEAMDTVSWENVEGKSGTEMMSGQVCCLLEAAQSTAGRQIWYQTLGKDAYPVLDGEHNTVVEKNGRCYNLTEITVDSVPAQQFTSNEIRPEIRIHSSAEGFTEQDYTVTYENNTKEGTATVLIRPSANGRFLFDEIRIPFVICKASAAPTGDSSLAACMAFLAASASALFALAYRKKQRP